MFTGAVFFKAIREGDLFPYGLFDQCMALSMHLFTLSTQVPDVPEALPYGTAVVLLGVGAGRQRPGDRACASACGRGRNGDAPCADDRRSADLRVRYGRREALKGVTFDVRRNEIFGIIGPAHSGKTTLLRVHQPHDR